MRKYREEHIDKAGQPACANESSIAHVREYWREFRGFNLRPTAAKQSECLCICCVWSRGHFAA